MKDLKRNDSGDLDLAAGDVALAVSDGRHVYDLLVISPGELRQFPTMGVGLAAYLDDDQASDLNHVVAVNAQADGLTVNRFNVYPGGKIDIDANY